VLDYPRFRLSGNASLTANGVMIFNDNGDDPATGGNPQIVALSGTGAPPADTPTETVTEAATAVREQVLHHFAGLRVDALDRAALIVLRRSGRQKSALGILVAAVVADIEGAVRSDGQAVRHAAGVGDALGSAIVLDAGTRHSMFENGQLDLVDVSMADLEQDRKDPHLSSKLQYFNRPAVYYAAFNQRGFAPFADRRVRQALPIASLLMRAGEGTARLVRIFRNER